MEALLSSSARLVSSRGAQSALFVLGRQASATGSSTMVNLSRWPCVSNVSLRGFRTASTSSLRRGANPTASSSPTSLTRRWASTKPASSSPAPPRPASGSSRSSGSKTSQQSGSTTSSSSSSSADAPVQELVIYRGPAASRPWINFVGGAFFFVSGLSIASVVQEHLSWPIWRSGDVNNPPELLEPWKRKLAAGGIFFLGSAFAWLFWIVPSKTITRLTLRPVERELIIRTASPGLVNLFPRFLLLGPFRQVAQRSGFHILARRNERVVPLDSVYRIYGSAVGAEWGASQAKRQSQSSSSSVAAQPQKKRSLQIIVGRERLFYSVEAAGGSDPSADPAIAKRGLYARGFFKLVYSLRGSTDWSDAVGPGQKEGDVRREALISGPKSAARPVQYRSLGPKEPWFMDRRNFDELLPLILRR